MLTNKVHVDQPEQLRVGEIVEVRSEAEILATLGTRTASWTACRSCRRCSRGAASGSGSTSSP